MLRLDGLEAPRSSPREWGCFYRPALAAGSGRVFPTRVGVFLMTASTTIDFGSLPHASGGVSTSSARRLCAGRSSPREWGCFRSRAGLEPAQLVFPTRVGVFLLTMRCGFLPSSLPHASGGVSSPELRDAVGRESSPREWGCFYRRLLDEESVPVFPTRVGVFRERCGLAAAKLGLPHASGGVSEVDGVIAAATRSSPREWGCFHENLS